MEQTATKERVARIAPDEAFPAEAADRPASFDFAEPDADAAKVEALLFSAHAALSPGRIADLLGLPSARPVREAVGRLNDEYASTGRSFRVEGVAGGYRLMTLPEHGELIARLDRREADAKLTTAAQETLAVIAYKQPVLRVDVEAVRGVGCGETIRSLMDKRLVKIAGRAELPGRPILYGTTRRFLEVFGLNSLKDLPKRE